VKSRDLLEELLCFDVILNPTTHDAFQRAWHVNLTVFPFLAHDEVERHVFLALGHALAAVFATGALTFGDSSADHTCVVEQALELGAKSAFRWWDRISWALLF
jgi:hypothetical protein